MRYIAYAPVTFQKSIILRKCAKFHETVVYELDFHQFETLRHVSKHRVLIIRRPCFAISPLPVWIFSLCSRNVLLAMFVEVRSPECYRRWRFVGLCLARRDFGILQACSSLAERCRNMTEEGVRFLPRLPSRFLRNACVRWSRSGYRRGAAWLIPRLT